MTSLTDVPKALPFCSANDFSTTWPIGVAGSHWAIGLAFLRRIVTWCGPETTAFLIEPAPARLASGDASFGSWMRFTENATSAGVSGLPSQNFTSERRLYTYFVGLAWCHDLASSGWSLRLLPNRSSASHSW